MRYLLILLLMCCGCAKTVYVPVPSCPPPQTVKRPVMMVGQLRDGDSSGLVLQYLLVDLRNLKGYADQMEQILEGYKVMSNNNTEMR